MGAGHTIVFIITTAKSDDGMEWNHRKTTNRKEATPIDATYRDWAASMSVLVAYQ